MIYDLLAPVYDAINSDIDYKTWADFIEKAVKKYGPNDPSLWLDLGCGTGKMTLELAKRGRDMIGIDYSAEMLDIARSEAEREGLDGILWLCQDMREFELYGTVDVVTSCLDSINHITETGDLDKCFSLVHNYLSPNGLFIFDINGKAKFETVYADHAYVMEEKESVCIWQNSYNPKSRACDFFITLFKENQNGTYERYDECQRERMYTIRTMRSRLEKNSMEFIGAFSDFNFTVADDSAERIYIVAKCKK